MNSMGKEVILSPSLWLWQMFSSCLTLFFVLGGSCSRSSSSRRDLPQPYGCILSTRSFSRHSVGTEVRFLLSSEILQVSFSHIFSPFAIPCRFLMTLSRISIHPQITMLTRMTVLVHQKVSQNCLQMLSVELYHISMVSYPQDCLKMSSTISLDPL